MVHLRCEVHCSEPNPEACSVSGRRPEQGHGQPRISTRIQQRGVSGHLGLARMRRSVVGKSKKAETLFLTVFQFLRIFERVTYSNFDISSDKGGKIMSISVNAAAGSLSIKNVAAEFGKTAKAIQEKDTGKSSTDTVTISNAAREAQRAEARNAMFIADNNAALEQSEKNWERIQEVGKSIVEDVETNNNIHAPLLSLLS